MADDDGEQAERDPRADEEDQQRDPEHDVGHDHRHDQQALIQALAEELVAGERECRRGADDRRDRARRECDDSTVADRGEDPVGVLRERGIERRAGRLTPEQSQITSPS